MTKQTKFFQKQILPVLLKYPVLSDASFFFFGSRVRGDSGSRSDIDLGILGKKKIPAGVKLSLEEDLENLPFFYKIDLVDFNDVSPKFKKEALKFSERIN